MKYIEQSTHRTERGKWTYYLMGAEFGMMKRFWSWMMVMAE